MSRPQEMLQTLNWTHADHHNFSINITDVQLVGNVFHEDVNGTWKLSNHAVGHIVCVIQQVLWQVYLAYQAICPLLPKPVTILMDYLPLWILTQGILNSVLLLAPSATKNKISEAFPGLHEYYRDDMNNGKSLSLMVLVRDMVSWGLVKLPTDCCVLVCGLSDQQCAVAANERRELWLRVQHSITATQVPSLLFLADWGANAPRRHSYLGNEEVQMNDIPTTLILKRLKKFDTTELRQTVCDSGINLGRAESAPAKYVPPTQVPLMSSV